MGVASLVCERTGWAGVVALVMLGLPLTASAQSETGPYSTERLFDFGTVMEDAPVVHTFAIENTGHEPLVITNVLVTAPLLFQNVRKRLLPGERLDVNISLGTPRAAGQYKGWLKVMFKGPGLTNLVFDVRGKIVPLIEMKPFPAFFVTTQRGQPKRATIDIINHEPDLLEIQRVEHASTRFTTDLKTVTPGQRFTLALDLDGKGAPGRATEVIKLFTSSKQRPVVQVQANTYIKERVYTFPETLDWGEVRRGDLRAHATLTNYLSQTLMVYQSGGTNFQVVAKSEAPFLRLSTELSKKYKDRCQITVEVIPDRLAAGPLNSRIEITTNDREFPVLEVQVTGVATDK